MPPRATGAATEARGTSRIWWGLLSRGLRGELFAVSGMGQDAEEIDAPPDGGGFGGRASSAVSITAGQCVARARGRV